MTRPLSRDRDAEARSNYGKRDGTDTAIPEKRKKERKKVNYKLQTRNHIALIAATIELRSSIDIRTHFAAYITRENE